MDERTRLMMIWPLAAPSAEERVIEAELGDLYIEPGEDLVPGTCAMLCEVPGHEAGGMHGTLTVGQAGDLSEGSRSTRCTSTASPRASSPSTATRWRPPTTRIRCWSPGYGPASILMMAFCADDRFGMLTPDRRHVRILDL